MGYPRTSVCPPCAAEQGCDTPGGTRRTQEQPRKQLQLTTTQQAGATLQIQQRKQKARKSS